jgi:hypothetical protein
MRVTAGGNVTAGDVDGHEPLPGDETRRNLRGEFPDRVALGDGEPPHALGRELDVALDRRWNVARAPLDLGGRHDDIAGPSVEFFRVLANRRFTAGLDVRELRGRDFAAASDCVCGVRLARFRCSIAIESVVAVS